MTTILAGPGRRPGRSPVPAGFRMTWTGWDGSVWDLSDSRVDGVQIGPGVRGLRFPSVRRFVDDAPGVDGERYRGHKVEARDVFWPLDVLSDARGQSWVDRDAAFWRTMRPDSPGSWAVIAPNGTTRTLTCRFASVDDAIEIDPAEVGWARWPIYLVADDDPYWTSAPVVRTFSPADPVDFFDPAGSPPFHISSGNLLATAAIDNPGDVPGYPIYRIDGPVTAVTVGVQDQVIEIPVELDEDEHLVLDTRPTGRAALLGDGTDVSSQLGAVSWARVPPGASVPLTLEMTGTGAVTVALTPRHFGAWG